MADPVRVSRQGLTACPGCKSFIKLAEVIADTYCPFCEAPAWPTGGVTRVSRPKFGGAASRSLIAATLLGAAVTFTACPSTGGPPGEKVVQDSGPGPSPLYGAPAPDGSAPEKRVPAPDSTDGPLYGNVPSDK